MNTKTPICIADDFKPLGKSFRIETPDTDAIFRDENASIWSHARNLEVQRNELIRGIKELRDCKGRYHSQQASERLFKMIEGY